MKLVLIMSFLVLGFSAQAEENFNTYYCSVESCDAHEDPCPDELTLKISDKTAILVYSEDNKLTGEPVVDDDHVKFDFSAGDQVETITFTKYQYAKLVSGQQSGGKLFAGVHRDKFYLRYQAKLSCLFLQGH